MSDQTSQIDHAQGLIAARIFKVVQMQVVDGTPIARKGAVRSSAAQVLKIGGGQGATAAALGGWSTCDTLAANNSRSSAIASTPAALETCVLESPLAQPPTPPPAHALHLLCLHLRVCVMMRACMAGAPRARAAGAEACQPQTEQQRRQQRWCGRRGGAS